MESNWFLDIFRRIARRIEPPVSPPSDTRPIEAYVIDALDWINEGFAYHNNKPILHAEQILRRGIRAHADLNHVPHRTMDHEMTDTNDEEATWRIALRNLVQDALRLQGESTGQPTERII